MIKTPLSTVIGGAFWTPGATVINGKEIFSVFVKSLFADGTQGFFYDPNDLSTMFQDAAGTVPVTAVGQSVGLIRDKSGRNNHAFQANSASRPILRKNAVTGANYLEFDGSDDFLQAANIDFTSTDKVSLFAGVRKLSDAATRAVLELSSNKNTNNGVFSLWAPLDVAATQVTWISKGSVERASVNNSIAAPASMVVSAKGDISGDISTLRINGSQTTNISDQGTGNYGNYPLYIGRRGGTSYPFNGHIYSLIGIGKLTSDSETASIEKELAKRTGVTLNV